MLTRISSQHNDENVAPSDEDTPARACDVADTTSPEREEEEDAKAGGEDAKAEDERADVTPADASFDQSSSQLAADAPDEVALMARACYAQSRVHTRFEADGRRLTLRERWAR